MESKNVDKIDYTTVDMFAMLCSIDYILKRYISIGQL